MKVIYLSKRKIFFQFCLVIACAAFGWFLRARLIPLSEGPGGREIPYVVTVETALEDVTPQKKYIATVEAINSVDIKSQVTGYLDKVLFTEGGFVRKDQTLFVIEQDKYIEDVNAAEAEVAKARANLKQITADHGRNKTLFRQKVITKSNIELSESALAQAQAALRQAEASAALARINLGHTQIKAPFDGYIGKALMTRGNYVDASGRTLARVVQVSPIRISFSVTDKDRLLAMRRTGTDAARTDNIKIVLADGEIIPADVSAMFFESEINSLTATVTAYADVMNASKLMLPGNHVDIIVGTEDERRAITLPPSAFIQDRSGTFVFVLDEEGKARKTYLKLGALIDGRQIVESGLEPGRHVVVEGMQKIENGSPVRQSRAVK